MEDEGGSEEPIILPRDDMVWHTFGDIPDAYWEMIFDRYMKLSNQQQAAWVRTANPWAVVILIEMFLDDMIEPKSITENARTLADLISELVFSVSQRYAEPLSPSNTRLLNEDSKEIGKRSELILIDLASLIGGADHMRNRYNLLKYLTDSIGKGKIPSKRFIHLLLTGPLILDGSQTYGEQILRYICFEPFVTALSDRGFKNPIELWPFYDHFRYKL